MYFLKNMSAPDKQELSAIQQTLHLEKKAYEIGFKWENPRQILDQIISEVAEVREVLESEAGDKQRLDEETGDMLMAVICFCFFMDMDPEDILHKANKKFTQRFAKMQAIMNERQIHSFEGMTTADILRFWEEAKNV